MKWPVMSLSNLFETISHIVFISSILYALLPPLEIFNGFPRAQKWYSLLLLIILHLAVNVRARLISMYQNVPTPNFYLTTENREIKKSPEPDK